MNAATQTLRPSAVESHVRRVARRIGCDRLGEASAIQAAARTLRAGHTAHRAIKAGVQVAATRAAILRRREPECDAFSWRDLLLDALGFIGALTLAVAIVLLMWVFFGGRHV